MKRAFLAVAVLALLCFGAAQQASAAGAIVVTVSSQEPNVTEYSVAWTATSGGDVNGNAVNVAAGYIFEAVFIPGAVTPTTLYDVVLNDQLGTIDQLVGTGANLSASVAKQPSFQPTLHWRGGALDLVITNAGTSTTGTVIIKVRPTQ